jgi:hypothetical protein
MTISLRGCVGFRSDDPFASLLEPHRVFVS